MTDTNFTTSTTSRSAPLWGSAGCGGDIVWRPTPDVIARAHLTRFMAAHGIAGFADRMARSTAVFDLSKGIAWPQWCVGGMTHIVFNCGDSQ